MASLELMFWSCCVDFLTLKARYLLGSTLLLLALKPRNLKCPISWRISVQVTWLFCLGNKQPL